MTKAHWMLSALGLAALAACEQTVTTTTTSTAVQATTSSPESACIAAVDRNMIVTGATVTGSDISPAGTVVTLRARDGSTWRCLASNDGVVAELSMT